MKRSKQVQASVSVSEVPYRWQGRTVSELTDDEIVTAVAAAGVIGLDTEDIFEGSPTHALMERLLVDPYSEAEEKRLFRRIHKMKRRLFVDLHSRLRLTHREWGARLGGRSATEITQMLRGSEEAL